MATIEELVTIKNALKDLPPCSSHEMRLVHALAVLEKTDGNRTKSAKILKMGLRTLRNWIPVIEYLILPVPKWGGHKSGTPPK